MKKTGKCIVVAQPGGIKFEGDDSWYNPSEGCKATVLKDFRGKVIEIDLMDNGKTFTSIKLVEGNTPTPGAPQPSAGPVLGSLWMEFFEDSNGVALCAKVKEFTLTHKIDFTQTGFNHINNTYYAFVFYKP